MCLIGMAREKKNPWIAAILNFMFYGAGYLYAGKRTTFGTMLLVGWAISLTAGETLDPNISLYGLGALLMSEIFIGFALAYDGYMAVKRK